jgi:hypothetical protein
MSSFSSMPRLMKAVADFESAIRATVEVRCHTSGVLVLHIKSDEDPSLQAQNRKFKSAREALDWVEAQ